ncbi:MAG TPA: hypothetical protein VN042_04600 [Asticcacaulis sp.]|nr:hypothetical protein [Asticcacaulis sp.]
MVMALVCLVYLNLYGRETVTFAEAVFPLSSLTVKSAVFTSPIEGAKAIPLIGATRLSGAPDADVHCATSWSGVKLMLTGTSLGMFFKGTFMSLQVSGAGF